MRKQTKHWLLDAAKHLGVPAYMVPWILADPRNPLHAQLLLLLNSRSPGE